MIDEVRADDLSAFEHRKDYAETSGRDRWTVRVVNAWVSSAVPPLRRRLTLHGVEPLAGRHKFRVEQAVRLGGLPDVLRAV